jgi:hypothetical protein
MSLVDIISATSLKAQFHCFSLADGIKTAADEQLRTKFENVYAAQSLQVPWQIIPGNHGR